MYLFNKRTRNLIKILWGVLATLVILSMIITYSGFTMLARTQTTQPSDISPEELELARATTTLDVNSLSTSSPELQPLLESIKEDMTSPSEPDVPPLQFGF